MAKVPLKITRDQWEALPAEKQAFYSEQDGAFVLLGEFEAAGIKVKQ